MNTETLSWGGKRRFTLIQLQPRFNCFQQLIGDFLEPDSLPKRACSAKIRNRRIARQWAQEKSNTS
jgi:hypothetical protein